MMTQQQRTQMQLEWIESNDKSTYQEWLEHELKQTRREMAAICDAYEVITNEAAEMYSDLHEVEHS